ncbi:hypothetical protein BN946_scf184993.g23 [Trametes cinnabarina]|uniref:CAF1B/HIR1 beta-propeller domain-containing protein n=1 Tax=Pycnoporus cinnabarinus TaxID=5643 RepID=A0A060STP4_PYCCI|nr:hypothetical protein BN946_scf184993.g23 [Trametes cinnabarina]
MRVRTLEIRWHDSKPISTCDFQPLPYKKARPSQDKQWAAQSYRLATGGEDNHVRLWMVHPNILPQSLVEGASEPPAPRPPRVEYLATLSRHSAAVNVVRFSPNGDLIASAGDDGMIIIWSPTNSPHATSYGSDLTPEDMQYEKEHWKPRTTFRSMILLGAPLGNISLREALIIVLAYSPPTMPSPMFRRESTASETESVITSVSEQLKDEASTSASGQQQQASALLTPTASVTSTPSMTMFPPPYERASSRRSSFSGSNAPSSPANYSRYGRSPSPMPALPAIRMAPSTAGNTWASVKLYGDESFTNFFRRLTFSPDGGLLLTPAGQFEDPSVIPATTSKSSEQRGRKGNPSSNDSKDSSSSVYIYSRANFARPPIARLPGHKKASVAVRFSPVLYELRPNVSAWEADPKTVMLDKDTEVSVDVDMGTAPASTDKDMTPFPSPMKQSSSQGSSHIAAPTPRIAIPSGPQAATMPSPASSVAESLRPPTPAASKPPSPIPIITPTPTASIFSLPYRMLYAVATMDTVMIYDTQQAGPVCLLTKLHYDEFTDMSWSPDGQCLILSSRDGYCTIVVFDEILPAYHTQQHTLQLQSIAHHHSLPLTNSTAATPMSTPATNATALPTLSPATPVIPAKRSAEPPLTPAASVDENLLGARALPEPADSAEASNAPAGSATASQDEVQEPPKKKRRAALTRVGDLGS